MEHTEFDSCQGKKSEILNEPRGEQAYAEVYQVILHMEKNLQILIPRSFIHFLRKNMDTQWGATSGFLEKPQ